MSLNEFEDELRKLHFHHLTKSSFYRLISERLFKPVEHDSNLISFPFVPAQMFKEFDLRSIEEVDVYKILRSSGTSGRPSKIFLDRETASFQSKTLVKLGSPFLGKKRLPMVVFDPETIVERGQGYSARGAAINGFKLFSSKTFFLVDQNDCIRFHEFEEFVDKNSDLPLLFFGFTFRVWEIIAKGDLDKLRAVLDRIKGKTIIHGGGWKKLTNVAVTNTAYDTFLKDRLGFDHILQYYGLIEQVGSLFFSCPSGFFHETEFSKVCIRDTVSLEPVEDGVQGCIQLMSLVPKSYPGHSILTEDMGEVVKGDCPCGNNNRRFLISGRFVKSEVRGCSNV